jgi:hypothetical protein
MVVLGLSKIGLAILFGSAVGVVLAAFPSSLLGVLLAFAGLELGLPARDVSGRNEFFVVVATAVGILAVDALVGFALGFGAALLLLKDRPHPQ